MRLLLKIASGISAWPFLRRNCLDKDVVMNVGQGLHGLGSWMSHCYDIRAEAAVLIATCGMPGGGVALLYASKELESTKESLTNFDQQIGVQIVQNALRVPLKTIADNAGMAWLLWCACHPPVWSCFPSKGMPFNRELQMQACRRVLRE